MDPSIAIPGVELLEELGRGGSSVVYRARRGGELCAVKIARAAGRDSAWFRREAAALARVTDAGVPTVLEVGEVRGVAYLVMELVEGETLAARLQRRRMSEDEALNVASGVARVLDAVHRRGLVHRDLSPRNVVLEEGGEVRVVDFGFATFAHSPRDTGGTQAYAAPEQQRVPVLVDARTDLYALGVVLFECLTGSLPGREAQQAIEDAHFGSALALVLRHLLAPVPAERYASAGAVLSDLARVRGGELPKGPAHESAPEALPFAGRAAERARLLQAWSDAREGRGRAALVIGPAGSGKSRLAREVMRAIEAGPRRAGLIGIRCDEADPRPLAALRAVFHRLAERVGRLDAESGEVAKHAVKRAVSGPLAPVVGALSPALAALGGVTQAPRPDVNAETFSELITELAIRLARELGGLAIFVDDAQWLEPPSAEVMARLASRVTQEPLLMVLAARTDPFGSTLPAAREDTLLRITLGPFSGSAMQALTTSYLGSEPSAALLEWVSSVSDRTPLGALELLDAMLDAGALAPLEGVWQFNRERADRMYLPSGALQLLARRLDELPAAARAVFQVAAVLGLSFEDSLLAEAAELDAADLGFALAEARRAHLIEVQSPARHRFVHDSVREALLGDLDSDARRATHQAIADALDRSSSQDVYALARHHAAAQPGPRPARAFETARAAARQALEELDSDAAQRFFEAARASAERAGIELDGQLLATAGEAALRLGAYEESIAHFTAALDRSGDPVERAALLARIAWAEQARPDADRAWSALDRAFRELGEEMPAEKVKMVGQTLLGFVRAKLGQPPGTTASARVLELLCQLHYQNGRLGTEYGKPLRVLQSALRGQVMAPALENGAALARVQASYGFVLTLIGRRASGKAQVDQARAQAASSGNPEIEAYCTQLSAIGACFAGDFDRATELFAGLFAERGAWLDMYDYCWDVHAAHLIEVLRGRPRDAWRWLESVIDRAAPHGRAPAPFLMIAHCARATLAALDRGSPEELRRALRIPVDFANPLRGFMRTGSWGSRARYLVETGAIGSELDALIAEFAAEGIQPRRAHPILFEYYVAVCDAHILRCLRAEASDRAGHVRDLERAVGDLGAVARYPLYRAHLRLAEGFLAWLQGAPARARSKLAEAEELADRASCPAVLFGVARARAHILTSEGRIQAARERARVALAIARDLGAVQRARWILDELGGSWSTADAARRSVVAMASSSGRRQLRTLLKLLRVCNSELDDHAQAALLIDELLENVSAERGMLVFEPVTNGATGVRVGRRRGGHDWAETSDATLLIEEVRKHAEPRARDGLLTSNGSSNEMSRAVAVPLFLNETVVGAVYLERAAAHTPFADADMDILLALSYQVPVALELTRSLAERENLEQNLRRAQKMEAVGRFAGGIAHDFNNMLTAMESSLSVAMGDGGLGAELRSELTIAQGAVRRASSLTRQLLKFARRQVPSSETRDLNEVLRQLAPMLQRLLGAQVEVRLDLRAQHAGAKIDSALFEQSIVNLALNARDAMPRGGRLSIASQDALFEASSRDVPHGLAPGAYVMVTVRDNGSGMAPEVRDSAFEPFFTTKGRGKGSGLGLSIVYGFVQQSDGVVELESAPGQGTEFRIYLPRSDRSPVRADSPERPSTTAPPSSAPKRSRPETILLVEDEELVRKAVQRSLERSGYQVLAARRGDAALDIMRRHNGEIDLLISDVLLPGMLGTELAKVVRQISPQTKLLLMSGYTDGELEGSLDGLTAAFLEKPFKPNDLDRTIHELLGHVPE